MEGTSVKKGGNAASTKGRKKKSQTWAKNWKKWNAAEHYEVDLVPSSIQMSQFNKLNVHKYEIC